MDIMIGLLGALILALLGRRMLKRPWLAGIIAFVILVVVLGLLPSGISLEGVAATLIGAVIGAAIPQAKK